MKRQTRANRILSFWTCIALVSKSWGVLESMKSETKPLWRNLKSLGSRSFRTPLLRAISNINFKVWMNLKVEVGQLASWLLARMNNINYGACIEINAMETRTKDIIIINGTDSIQR